MGREHVIRVLIVDDSAIVRKILSETLGSEPDIEVVGTAPDPFIAANKIKALSPDVITLDIEMPGMDGLTFLKKLMHFRPMPVIVVSSIAQRSCAIALEAMRVGALDVMAKPGGPFSVGDLKHTLAEKVRAAARARVSLGSAVAPSRMPDSRRQSSSKHNLIAIGASTGGTEAIRAVLEAMPPDVPPIVIAQHIPPVFSAAFAERLAKTCRIQVREAMTGDVLQNGLALIAPGDRHMTVEKCVQGYRVLVENGPKVCYQRPSVDVLFNSVAASAAEFASAALLTGMGSDGARGLLQIRSRKGTTIAQNEESCVVFGMPKEAIRMGAAEEVLPLSQIARSLLRASTNRCMTMAKE